MFFYKLLHYLAVGVCVVMAIVWVAFAIVLFRKGVSARAEEKRSKKALMICLSTAMIVFPLGYAGWVYMQFQTFKEECLNIKPLIQYSEVSERQSSLYIEQTPGLVRPKEVFFPIRDIRKQTGLLCVEQKHHNHASKDGKKYRYWRQCDDGHITNTNELRSKYKISVSKEDYASGLGFSFNYKVQEISSGKVIAEAHELLFGRGSISQIFIRKSFFKGSRYLVCGYADNNPRARGTRKGGVVPYIELRAGPAKLDSWISGSLASQ